MRLTPQFALLSLLSCGTMLWQADLATAQIPSIFQPTVPESSMVRPMGEVDPTEPIHVVITNRLTVPLGLGFSGGANVEVAPGDTAKLTFTTVPINLFVYPLAQEVSVRSTVVVDNNTISAEITALTSVAPGDATLNVDGAGTVYIY